MFLQLAVRFDDYGSHELEITAMMALCMSEAISCNTRTMWISETAGFKWDSNA